MGYTLYWWELDCCPLDPRTPTLVPFQSKWGNDNKIVACTALPWEHSKSNSFIPPVSLIPRVAGSRTRGIQVLLGCVYVSACFIVMKIKRLHYSLHIPLGTPKEHIRIWNVPEVKNSGWHFHLIRVIRPSVPLHNSPGRIHPYEYKTLYLVQRVLNDTFVIFLLYLASWGHYRFLPLPTLCLKRSFSPWCHSCIPIWKRWAMCSCVCTDFALLCTPSWVLRVLSTAAGWKLTINKPFFE